MNKMEDRWLSITAICKYLVVSIDTVYKWIDKHGMPAHRMDRLWKFKKDEVDEWVKAGGAVEPVQDVDGNELLPALDNHSMGTIFEELIRRFNEDNNEEAGEHFTPREVVKLMADLIFLPVADDIESSTCLVYDGACGTGGMLTVAEEHLAELAQSHGKDVSIHLFGQEVQPETYAISKADLLLKGEGAEAENMKYDYTLSNPPYGKIWKTDLECLGGKGDIKDPRFVTQHRLERFERTCAKAKEEPLANLARHVAETLGAGPYLDFNAFMGVAQADADKHGVKLTAKRKKLLQSDLCNTHKDAAPVVKKVYKPGKATPDPIHGLFEAVVGGKRPAWSNTSRTPPCVTASRCHSWKKAALIVMELGPSSGARCCPTPRMPGSTRAKSWWLRNLIHPPLLPARAHAHPR